MEKITNIVKKIPTIKAEQYKSDMSHFGYTVLGETIEGNKTVLQLQREPSILNKKLKYYEKQYHLLHKKVFPLGGLIFTILGIVALVLALVFAETNVLISIISYIAMGILLPIGIFAIIAFLILKIKRKKITLEILKRCDQLQGFGVCSLPSNSFDNTSVNNDPVDQQIIK